jgi:hypothetical protein
MMIEATIILYLIGVHTKVTKYDLVLIINTQYIEPYNINK